MQEIILCWCPKFTFHCMLSNNHSNTFLLITAFQNKTQISSFSLSVSLSLSLSLYTHTHTHTHTNIHTHAHTKTQTHANAHTQTQTHARTHTHTHTHTHTNTYIYTYIIVCDSDVKNSNLYWSSSGSNMRRYPGFLDWGLPEYGLASTSKQMPDY